MEFLTFRLKDLIDILLVWFITYETLKLFKGTRASYIFWGIVLIVIAAIIASFLHLDAFNWIMSQIESIALIALIVIFQPEIRKVLATIGRTSFLRKLYPSGGLQEISKIATSALMLRDRKLGGIIVIERKDSLKEFIDESGVPVDAEISPPLIVTIFTPPTPLHDGAIIVKEDRIIACRVVLPLSNNPNIDPSFGTRHRAAIGITEITDAVSIVVSEERRSIRIAVNGEITPPLTKDDLISMLIKLIYGETEINE